MSQYTTGTVTVSNGSPTVNGSGTTWSGNVTAGSVFTITGSGVPYIVGSVDSSTQITLTGNYAGTGASGQSYSLTTSFTPNRKLPYMEQGDVDPATVHKRAMVQLDTLLGTAFSANRVIYTDASGNLINGSGLTYDGTTFAAKSLTVTSSAGTFSGTLGVTGASTFSTVSASSAANVTTIDSLNNAQNYNGLIHFKRNGTSKYYLALDSSDGLAVLNGAASSAYLTVSSTGLAPTGLLDISNAASGQIKFPASQNASSNANTLDDYEEGTWTPALASSGASFSHTVQVGTYVKVGQLVYAQANVTASATGTLTNVLSMTGFPFTPDGTSNATVGAFVAYTTFSVLPTIYLGSGASTAFFASSVGADVTPNDAGLGSSKNIRVIFIFRANG